MVIKKKFIFTLLLITLSLHAILWFVTDELYVRIIPFLPAIISLTSFFLINNKHFLPSNKFLYKYFIVKSINILVNLLVFTLIFLSSFGDKILTVFVYLVTYLVLLLHFTYFTVKDSNARE